jgi:cytochrome c oxidase subunit IV
MTHPHPHLSDDDFDQKDPEAIHHIVTPATYIAVWITLLIATALTTGAAFIDLKDFNPVLALGIACFKAGIVILFFMHVYYVSRLTKLTVAAGFFTFIVLIMMTMSDYVSRSWGLW